MQMIVRDAHIGLLAALRQFIDSRAAGDGQAEPIAYIETSRAENWSSATFAGQRHHLTVVIIGALPAVEALIDALTDLESANISVRGHILAEAAVVDIDVSLAGPLPRARVAIEALTVED